MSNFGWFCLMVIGIFFSIALMALATGGGSCG